MQNCTVDSLDGVIHVSSAYTSITGVAVVSVLVVMPVGAGEDVDVGGWEGCLRTRMGSD